MIFITNSQFGYSSTIKFSLSLFQDTLQDVSGITDGKHTTNVVFFTLFHTTAPNQHLILFFYNIIIKNYCSTTLRNAKH